MFTILLLCGYYGVCLVRFSCFLNSYFIITLEIFYNYFIVTLKLLWVTFDSVLSWFGWNFVLLLFTFSLLFLNTFIGYHRSFRLLLYLFIGQMEYENQLLTCMSSWKIKSQNIYLGAICNFEVLLGTFVEVPHVVPLVVHLL